MENGGETMLKVEKIAEGKKVISVNRDTAINFNAGRVFITQKDNNRYFSLVLTKEEFLAIAEEIRED
jgi:hypothetical protein